MSYLDVKSKQKNLKNYKNGNDVLYHVFTDEAECKAVYNYFVRKETKRINTVQKNLQKMLDIIQPV